MTYRFYSDNALLFALEDVTEYDTATPYRYAVSRFIELAEQIRRGQPVTVISHNDPERTVTLQTVGALLNWISEHFGGFERHVH